VIEFFSEGVDFDREDKIKLEKWISNKVLSLGYELNWMNYIFTNDKLLLEINKKFLNHNYYTDIITFSYREDKSIEADIYISVDRVRDNAKDLAQKFDKELLRVIFHGLLHIVGFDDKSEKEKLVMREEEEKYIDEYENAG